MPKFVSHSFLDHIAPAGGVGQLVPIDRVTPNPDQPRKRYRQDELEALASSIRAHGLINPIQQEQLSARALKREKRQEPSVTPRMFIRSVQALHQRVERLDVRQLKPKDRDRLRTHIEQTISRLSTVLKKLDGKRTSDSH